MNIANEMTATLQAWKLVNDISDKICRRMNRETILEMMFRIAMDNKADPAEIIRTLYDNIVDNETAVANIIGNDLTNKIKTHVHNTTANFLPGIPGSSLQNKADECQKHRREAVSKTGVVQS